MITTQPFTMPNLVLQVNKTGVKPKKVKMFKKLWGKKDGTMPEGRAASIIVSIH